MSFRQLRTHLARPTKMAAISMRIRGETSRAVMLDEAVIALLVLCEDGRDGRCG